jgi:hypothetical protein
MSYIMEAVPMKTSGTNRRLRVLLSAIKDGTLIPRPDFQRRLVWTNKHKQEFIRTVLERFPFPEIYIAAGEVDTETGKGTELLVDGQQRLTTLLQYFSGSPDLRLGSLCAYTELSQDDKLQFLEYEVVVRDLGKKTIEEIKEVFQRINSTKYSLNAMEIHNARFDGALKQFAEKISKHSFFSKHRIFKTNDIRRMGDLVFVLTVIITLLSAYFNREDMVEEFLAKYNDNFASSEHIWNDLLSVFRTIDDFKLEPSCRAWKKADLLNLIVEVHRHKIRENVTVDAALGSRLSSFYRLVDQHRTTREGGADIAKYYSAVIQGANDRSNRIARGDIIRRVIRGELAF